MVRSSSYWYCLPNTSRTTPARNHRTPPAARTIARTSHRFARDVRHGAREPLRPFRDDILLFLADFSLPPNMSTSARVFLIDGSSQMYRAYHAMRGGGLSGPGGKTTHAVYIFVNMLRKLMQDHQPQFIGASFDLPGRTFRDDLVSDYKANRTPMPPDLAEQIPWVHEACEALGVPIITSERYEADDVIGTLATKAVGGRLRGRDRHRRQGLLPARARRHQGLQPARRRHLVRRRRREGEVRRRSRRRSSTCSR